jgi:hypothetical protein
MCSTSTSSKKSTEDQVTLQLMVLSAISKGLGAKLIGQDLSSAMNLAHLKAYFEDNHKKLKYFEASISLEPHDCTYEVFEKNVWHENKDLKSFKFEITSDFCLTPNDKFLIGTEVFVEIEYLKQEELTLKNCEETLILIETELQKMNSENCTPLSYLRFNLFQGSVLLEIIQRNHITSIEEKLFENIKQSLIEEQNKLKWILRSANL